MESVYIVRSFGVGTYLYLTILDLDSMDLRNLGGHTFWVGTEPQMDHHATLD